MPRLQLCEVGMLKTCLCLLSALLADNIEVSGELHIERLYLFCLIWTFGGLLDVNDRKAFSDLLATLSTALPDDDRDINVFDYYVDESGEWDPWHSKVPETISTDNQDVLGEVFIDTVDTIRTRLLVEFSAASGRNVLLVGPHGSGKTSILNDYMHSQDPQLSVCKRLVFSGASTAFQLQQFIDSNIYHRQGFVYGAKENKNLKVFIDDLNLPLPNTHGAQRCNELLRQLLDEKQLCTLVRPFEWRTVEGLSIVSAMALSDNPAASNRLIGERLLRHFAVFSMPAPQGESLKTMVHGILKVNMTKGETTGLDLDLHNALVSASCEMLISIQNVLRLTPMEGRDHYLFTLKDITKCFQCLRRLADESKADDIMVISLWRHEMIRIVRDGISRMSDLNWFDNKLSSVLEDTWKDKLSGLRENFVTFPVDARVFQRPVTSVGAKHVKVALQPIDKLSDLHSCLNTHLNRYNDEFGNIRLNTMLSDFVISHVVRMHRILSFSHGGNMLLIGAVGSNLSTLCRLALHVADIPIHKIDASKQSNFFDGLRSAVRLSGSEGKVISLLFTSSDLENLIYLDAVNSLLISGEYPHLFSNDEMEGLLQAIHPAMKREVSKSSVDPMRFFVSRVKSNLHILICLHPGHELLVNAASNYPGLLTGCQVNWLCDWPQETLLGDASYFITKHQLTEDFEDLRESITTSLANIHSFVLRDCKQMPWAGDVSANISMTTIKVHEKKKDQLKYQTDNVPNLPYSKVILHERIRLKHKERSKAKNEIYVGPTTYRRLMETFRYLYFLKSEERTRSVEQLKKVLATLDKTRVDAKVMKKGIKTLNEKFEGAQTNTAGLLKKLTAKATALEKLKAKIGLSKSLDAYLQLTEMDVEEEEEDELLKEEYDQYDAEFDRMREANLKSRQIQAKDELASSKAHVEECRTNLAYARQQVMIWRSKVDRGVIEHVRAFSNPPILVGQIIEMVMVLIGKRLPSQRITEVRESSTGKEDLSSRMSTSSSSGPKLVVKKAKPKEPGDRFDKAQWKSMQQTMSDSVKFVDMLHNLSWEDGLPSDVLTAVESYLACSKDGQLGVTGEGSLLDNAQDKQFIAVKQRSPSPGARSGLTIAGAKYASEDCATLVHYTIAIVEYSRLCGPLKSSLERMHELEREIEENERLQKIQELEELAAMGFNFKDKESPKICTSNLSSRLHEFPFQDVLSAYSLFDDFRPDLINLILKKLVPENMRITVVSKKFESYADQTEKWYGTQYKVNKFSAKQMKKWTNCGFQDNLRLPKKNEFIPTNFCLVAADSEPAGMPEIVKNTDFCRLWYKQDSTFLKPKACVNVDFISPVAYTDPLHTNFNALFTQLFDDALTEYTYMAEIAGLKYSLDSSIYGLTLTVKGYSDKLPILLEKILEKMATFKVDPNRLAIFKDIHGRNLRNFQAEQPHQHAIYYTNMLTSETLWNKEELLQALDDVTATNLQHFISQLLGKLFIEGLIFGNVTKAQSIQMTDMIERILIENCNTKPLLPSQHRKLREVQLPDGCYFLHKQKNVVHESSSIEVYYQCGQQNTESNILLELFCQVISEPCFNILRTKEQLGYIVFSGVRRSKGVQGLRVIIQSSKPPQFVEGRIEAFIQKVEEILESMSNDEFNKHVTALSSKRLEKPKKLVQQNNKYWTEIISSFYNFDRDNVEVTFLQKLTKDDLLKFYREKIALNAPQRHKLSVHVLSEVPQNPDTNNVGNNVEKTDCEGGDGFIPAPELPMPVIITDVMEFKRDLGLFPLPKPFIEVTLAKSKL